MGVKSSYYIHVEKNVHLFLILIDSYMYEYDFTLSPIQKSHSIFFYHHCIVSWHCKKQTQTNKQSKKTNKQRENLNSCCPWVTLGERRIDRKLISLFLWNTLMRKPSLSALKIPTLTASKYHSVLCISCLLTSSCFYKPYYVLLHKYVKILLCFFELMALSSLIAQGHWE